MSSFVHKASLQYFYDNEAAKKLADLDNRVSPEEASAPVDNKFYKSISPPPVLFTDTFRWALRHEHLSDRPLNGMILQDTGERVRVLQEKEDDNVSIASPPSCIDVHEVDGIRCLDC
jgi:hypothetical protein